MMSGALLNLRRGRDAREVRPRGKRVRLRRSRQGYEGNSGHEFWRGAKKKQARDSETEGHAVAVLNVVRV